MSLAEIQTAILTANYEHAEDLLSTFVVPETQPYLGAWYQGLCHVLQGDEEAAQALWFGTLMELSEEEAVSATDSLCNMLSDFAHFKTLQEQWQEAWLLRQYLGELNPNYFDNRFALLSLNDRLGLIDELETLGQDIIQGLFIEQTFNASPLSLALSILIFQTHEVLAFSEEGTYLDLLQEIAEQDPEQKEILKQAFCEFITRRLGTTDQRLEIAQSLEAWSEGDFPRLALIIPFYQQVDRYDSAIVTAEKFLAAAETQADQIAGYYMLMQSLLKSGSHFHQVKTLQTHYLQLLQDVLETPEITDPNTINNLIILPSFLSYLQDCPAENNALKQSIADRFTQLIQASINTSIPMTIDPPSTTEEPDTTTPSEDDVILPEEAVKPKPQLRIGYISECLRRHSIGYLVRDIFKYHDRSQVEIIAYTFEKTDDAIQQEIIEGGQAIKIITNPDPGFIYHLIQNDRLDILVDLDSLTSRQICRILALKPAPIQISWLGYDAAELPTVDYFLVDPYVMPEQAQKYYQEKLWHFPQTYIAVNGFEVGVSPLRREDLGVPPKAIVYFSSQTGYKRNPENIQQQLQILKAVANSYFFIKGYYSDLEALKGFFAQLCQQEGVEFDRLRFLDKVDEEETHRAILSLADIMLDTYPYNGATTTLEALWLGIPVVTQVGQQFSARTSYSALMNLGITAGIAWNDREYVDWGIELGQNFSLRQQVSLALQKSRYHAPLWHPQPFVKRLEQAYRTIQMQHLGGRSSSASWSRSSLCSARWTIS